PGYICILVVGVTPMIRCTAQVELILTRMIQKTIPRLPGSGETAEPSLLGGRQIRLGGVILPSRFARDYATVDSLNRLSCLVTIAPLASGNNQTNRNETRSTPKDEFHKFSSLAVVVQMIPARRTKQSDSRLRGTVQFLSCS